MAYRVELTLPRIVERNRAATLTLPVRNDANAEQTAGAGSKVSIWLGNALVVDEADVTAGPPASYSLLAATTTSLALSDEWYERWTLTGLGVFTQSGYLVRTPYHSRVTDGALERIHPELLDFLPPGETTAEKARVAASERIQRMLIAKGRRPWLIFDQAALFDADLYFSLHYWANDARARTSSSADYKALADEYEAKAERLFGAYTGWRYDESETGTIDADAVQSAEPGGYVFTSGRRRRSYASRYAP